ncbi:MAG: class I SAM-dependent methyltransferase, partial [Planctomyces sp.]
VWGYLNSQPHQERSDRIFSAFAGRRPQRLLELGCAEGFLTRRLAGLAEEIVACDLSEMAVQRAQAYCSDLSNVRFLATDVRDRLPEGSFDECLASDVLYYLSPSEIEVLGDRLR